MKHNIMLRTGTLRRQRGLEEEGELRSDPTAADETLGSYSVLEPGQY